MDMDKRSQELNIEALTDNLPRVMDFLDSFLEEAECPMQLQMSLDLAVEEIFVNIANYAYAPGTGNANIALEFSEDDRMLSITFRDSGTPYDPLSKEDPDVTLSADERQIGGLGIFLTKKFMDDLTYEYRDGQNVLRLFKKLQ